MKQPDPTHANSSTASVSPTTEDELDSWIAQHPSALNMLEELTSASKGKEIVMFLDYDGTLSPIVDDPDQAFMSEEMRTTVRNVATCFPTAIVSGRCIDKVYSFIRLDELFYAGSHGMDIKGPSKNIGRNHQPIMFQPASAYLPMINEVTGVLFEKTKSISGSRVENNKFCVSVHYRCVDEKNWDVVKERVQEVLNHYPQLRLTRGRKVLEVRPNIKWDKGKAVKFLLESLGYANSENVFPLYIGDDRTDEDAFRVLRERGQGLGILVSKIPKETNASYTLREPSEVKEFLGRLVGWKQLSS